MAALGSGGSLKSVLPSAVLHGGIRDVKALLFLLVTATVANAALIAHVATDRGVIDVELQHAKAPQAVANFITLAQGTRGRIDPATGAVIDTPLYVGEKFFRVINDTTFKIAQTGSGTGTNSGGPGFTFKDEFDPTLTHVPYVLSMANSGPNTNGSQIFFTGNATIPSLNNVHTVFGLVTDVPSRAVIDAIHGAGTNATTITGITFDRTDPAAVAFNEHAQGLPTVERAGGRMDLVPGVSNTWVLNPLISVGDVFSAFRSTALSTWSELGSSRQHIGIGTPFLTPVALYMPLDVPLAPRAFYNLSVARHPGAVAPSHFGSRTVTIPLSGGILTLAFTSAGNVGTTTYTPTSGSPIPSTLGLLDFRSGAHDVFFVTDSPQLNPRYLRFKLGCDSATGTLINCRHKTEYFDSFFGWQPFASGNGTITR